MPTIFTRSLILAALAASCSLALFVHADEPAATPKSIPMMSMGSMKPANSPAADQPTITGDGKAEASLTMDVRRYDFAGTRTYNRMYMPEGVVLSTTKPDGITKEPHYNGTPKYAVITIGNGTPNQFTL